MFTLETRGPGYENPIPLELKARFTDQTVLHAYLTRSMLMAGAHIMCLRGDRASPVLQVPSTRPRVPIATLTELRSVRSVRANWSRSTFLLHIESPVQFSATSVLNTAFVIFRLSPSRQLKCQRGSLSCSCSETVFSCPASDMMRPRASERKVRHLVLNSLWFAGLRIVACAPCCSVLPLGHPSRSSSRPACPAPQSPPLRTSLGTLPLMCDRRPRVARVRWHLKSRRPVGVGSLLQMKRERTTLHMGI